MAFAGTGLIVVRRRWPDFIAGEHNDVAGVLLGIVGAIYGILLAFVVVALYTSFTDAGNNVRDEASDVSQVYLDSRALGISASMTQAVSAYVHDVVNKEWPLMAVGEYSEDVDEGLQSMFSTLQNYEPATQAQIEFYRAAINDIDRVTVERRYRVY